MANTTYLSQRNERLKEEAKLKPKVSPIRPTDSIAQGSQADPRLAPTVDTARRNQQRAEDFETYQDLTPSGSPTSPTVTQNQLRERQVIRERNPELQNGTFFRNGVPISAAEAQRDFDARLAANQAARAEEERRARAKANIIRQQGKINANKAQNLDRPFNQAGYPATTAGEFVSGALPDYITNQGARLYNWIDNATGGYASRLTDMYNLDKPLYGIPENIAEGRAPFAGIGQEGGENKYRPTPLRPETATGGVSTRADGLQPNTIIADDKGTRQYVRPDGTSVNTTGLAPGDGIDYQGKRVFGTDFITDDRPLAERQAGDEAARQRLRTESAQRIKALQNEQLYQKQVARAQRLRGGGAASGSALRARDINKFYDDAEKRLLKSDSLSKNAQLAALGRDRISALNRVDINQRNLTKDQLDFQRSLSSDQNQLYRDALERQDELTGNFFEGQQFNRGQAATFLGEDLGDIKMRDPELGTALERDLPGLMSLMGQINEQLQGKVNWKIDNISQLMDLTSDPKTFSDRFGDIFGGRNPFNGRKLTLKGKNGEVIATVDMPKGFQLSREFYSEYYNRNRR